MVDDRLTSLKAVDGEYMKSYKVTPSIQHHSLIKGDGEKKKKHKNMDLYEARRYARLIDGEVIR